MSKRFRLQWWDGDEDVPSLGEVVKDMLAWHEHVWYYEGVEVLRYVSEDDSFRFNGGVYRRETSEGLDTSNGGG